MAVEFSGTVVALTVGHIMPRRALEKVCGLVVHALNRGVRRQQLFFEAKDYLTFERVLVEALRHVPIPLLAYCIMPNHWHLVMSPRGEELPHFMHWLTLTHAKRWHQAHGTSGTGSVYQNRYTAVPVQTETHLIALLRYVERNAARGGLVQRAEEWRWCSLWQRCNSCHDVPLAEWPVLLPDNWLEMVNMPEAPHQLANVRRAVTGGRPLGDPAWSATVRERLVGPVRPRGRPPLRNPV